MRKTSKKTLKRKLDLLCSKIVRARGKCEFCGRKETLQAAHLFSRRFLNTRWDLSNILCLCAGCHFAAHSCPITFAEKVKRILGEDKYELLKESHNLIYKPTISDLEIKIKILKEELVLKRVNPSFTLGVMKDPRLTEEALRRADTLMILRMRVNKLGCRSKESQLASPHYLMTNPTFRSVPPKKYNKVILSGK